MKRVLFARGVNTVECARGIEVLVVKLRLTLHLSLALTLPCGAAYDFVRRVSREEENAGALSPTSLSPRVRAVMDPDDFCFSLYRRTGWPTVAEMCRVASLKLVPA